MRYIEKSVESGCYPLEQRHQTPPTTCEQATLAWDRFKAKSAVTERLCVEQYSLCAYSEIRPDQYNLGTHIEHVRPKCLYPATTFDYQNLVLSAYSDTDLATKDSAEIFGGHAILKKSNTYDVTQFVSCLQSDCAHFFAYLSDGRVEASLTLTATESEKAQHTIEVLNLNSPYLVNQRKKWLDELDSYIDEHLDNDWSLKDLAEIYLCPRMGKLDPFFTASYQRFKLLGL